MEERLREIVKNLNLSDGAPEVSLNKLMESLELALPAQYVEFMKCTNGVDGFIGNSYIQIWKVEEMTFLNDENAVNEFAPGLVLFGSDGGGEAFAFDARTEEMPIVNVPFVGMGLDVVRICAPTFNQFLLSYDKN